MIITTEAVKLCRAKFPKMCLYDENGTRFVSPSRYIQKEFTVGGMLTYAPSISTSSTEYEESLLICHDQELYQVVFDYMEQLLRIQEKDEEGDIQVKSTSILKD